MVEIFIDEEDLKLVIRTLRWESWRIRSTAQKVETSFLTTPETAREQAEIAESYAKIAESYEVLAYDLQEYIDNGPL